MYRNSWQHHDPESPQGCVASPNRTPAWADQLASSHLSETRKHRQRMDHPSRPHRHECAMETTRSDWHATTCPGKCDPDAVARGRPAAYESAGPVCFGTQRARAHHPVCARAHPKHRKRPAWERKPSIWLGSSRLAACIAKSFLRSGDSCRGHRAHLHQLHVLSASIGRGGQILALAVSMSESSVHTPSQSFHRSMR